MLVEPNQRKASFLSAAGRELGLILNVEARRADEIDSRETLLPDVVTSRALASLPALCVLSAPFFRSNTRALFHKGREHVEELEESRALWQFDVLTLILATPAATARSSKFAIYVREQQLRRTTSWRPA